jgi:TPR repeat protein
MAYVAWAQQSAPPVAPDLQAALSKVDAGDPSALTALADAGRADAQVYAGMLFLRGRGSIQRDPPRGCAYEEKASATRADAMHLVGECRRLGLAGKPDPEGARQAFAKASAMGYPKSKCALGQMLMTEPGEAARGLSLCKEAAIAGDVDARLAVGDAYFSGRGAPLDRAEARKWYEQAAAQQQPQAMRKLGEMYASGDGGKRDARKAVELWQGAEKAGDPLACILVADQLFSDLTGGRKPAPGQYAFKGGVPVQQVEAVEAWYREALERDPRPDVQKRAKYAIAVLDSFKQAGAVSVR